MGTNIVRILKHPVDRDCVLLDCAPDLNQTVTKFGPARVSKDDRAYVLHHSHIDALYRFARLNDLHVVDDRRTSNHHTGFRIPPAECRSCGQAGSRMEPPAVCPSCGQTWDAIAPPVRDDPITKTPCTRCGHKQPGRFPYCSKCGAQMAYAEQPRRDPLPRTKLADPVPIAATLVETFRQEAHRTEGVTHGPWLPNRDPDTRRPIEDHPLPEPETEYDPTTDPSWQGTEPSKAEPAPDRVDRQHRINAAQAAVRHQPVPDRSVAEQQVRDQQETPSHPGPVRRRVCCNRLESQPHTEGCYMRPADEDPEPEQTPTDEPTVEDPPPWSENGWSWG